MNVSSFLSSAGAKYVQLPLVLDWYFDFFFLLRKENKTFIHSYCSLRAVTELTIKDKLE